MPRDELPPNQRPGLHSDILFKTIEQDPGLVSRGFVTFVFVPTLGYKHKHQSLPFCEQLLGLLSLHARLANSSSSRNSVSLLAGQQQQQQILSLRMLIQRLDDSLLEHVFSKLPASALASAQRVCKQWYAKSCVFLSFLYLTGWHTNLQR